MKRKSIFGKKRRAWRILGGILAAMLWLSGCSFAGLKLSGSDRGPSAGAASGENVGGAAGSETAGGINGNVEPHYYRIEETVLPNMDRALELSLPADRWGGDGWAGSEPFLSVGDTLYRTFTIWGNVEGEEWPGVYGYGVQYIEPPYGEWQTICVNGWLWEENAYWFEEALQVTKDHRMIARLYRTISNEEKQYTLGEIHRDGTCELLSEEEQEQLAGELTDWENPREDLDLDFLNTMGKAGADPTYLHRIKGTAGKEFVADVRKLWQYTMEGPVELFAFKDQDYVLDDLYGLAEMEDGFLVMGGYKGKCYLLRLLEVAEPVAPEKTEIVLADALVSGSLQEVIVNFNRSNPDYRVVVRTVPTNQFGVEACTEFRTQIQMEISDGKGPDILGQGALWDYETYAAKGMLECLDSVTEGDTDLLSSVMRSGMVDGKRYGLPVRCNPLFLSGNADLIGSRRGWNFRELMAAVEQSDAEYLCARYNSVMDGMDIVYNFVLRDNGDKTYIDWEAGKSHLTEQPFLDALEFAKKYGADEKAPGENALGPALREGRIALRDLQVVLPSDLLVNTEIFEGRDAYIGYPGTEDTGVYLLTISYYVNAASANKEGAKAFLKYLLSEESQLILTDISQGGNFPVRKSTLEANIRLAEKDLGGGKYGKTGTFYYNGLAFTLAPTLPVEQGEMFLSMLEHAQPYDVKADAVADIFEEELAPYFTGERSAEETARILDNRVQLYLDEQK